MSISSLKAKNQLCTAPSGEPKYNVRIKDSSGETLTLSCPKANRALVALMDLSAVNGGAASHWGGPAALAEAMSALHAIMFKKENWFDYYNFVNDVGHGENGIYALRANYGYGGLSIEDLKGFRKLDTKLTGHGEGHLYPEGVLLSNGPLGSSCGQAQGLAMADCLLGNDRVTVNVVSDGASMEGEAKEMFAAVPGFAKKGKLNPFVLMISDNNTKLSGRIDADSFSMDPTFNSLEALGWKVITVEKGNDLAACLNGVEEALRVVSKTQPVCLRLKTVKGFGVKSTEEHSAGGHGFPIKAYSEDIHNFIAEILDNNVPEELKAWANELTKKPEAGASGPKKEKAQAGFSRAAINMAKKGYPVVSISSDLQGSTGMAGFQKEFPEQSFDVGIAESNMVSVGAGFAKQGLIPIVDTFSAFGVTKGNLPLIMASLSQAPVIAVFSHTGFQDAADGASHQSLTYLATTSCIPHTDVVVVSHSKEAEVLMEEAIKQYSEKVKKGETPNSTLFFVGRENFLPEVPIAKDDGYGHGQLLCDGEDVTIAACGPMVFKALEAKELLAKEGISAAVINNRFVNHPDIELVKTQVLKTKNRLITIEDHQLTGGMGSQLIHKLKLADISINAGSLAVDGEFGQSAYVADHLYKKHKLSADDIVSTFNRL